MVPASAGELERLAYDLSLHSLQEQEAALTELRSRTSVVLAAATLVASFLGARAIDGEGLSYWNALGLIALVAAILLSVYVLIPKDELQFALSGARTYERFADGNPDMPDVYRTLAYWLHAAWEGNQTLIKPAFRAFTAACVALAVEVLAWSIQLAGTLS